MTKTIEVTDIEKTHKNPVAELVQTACKFDSHILGLRQKVRALMQRALWE